MNRGRYGAPARQRVHRRYDPFARNPAALSISDDFEVDTDGIPQGWANVGALTPTIQVNKRRLLMTCAAATGADMAAIERPTSMTGPCCYVVHVSFAARFNFNSCGLYLRNTTSGLILANRIVRADTTIGNTQVNGEKFSSFTNRTSFFSSFSHYQQAAWLRFNFDGTTVFLDVSFDGVDWYNFHSETLSGYFTGGNLPDRVGLCLGSFSVNQPFAAFRSFRHFRGASVDVGRMVSSPVNETEF